VSSDRNHILDTVVLLYFLLVEQDDLLRQLIGDPLRVPLAVYDPDDRSLDEEAYRHPDLLSEMRQAVRHYEVATRIDGANSKLLERIQRVDDLFDNGHLTAVNMSGDEAGFAARLQSRTSTVEYGLRVPLGAGEAACVAIAWKRDWAIATDDVAALTVLDQLHGERTYDYERIRKLLIRATQEERLTRSQANEIHAEMRDLGFWDTGTPFPST
jgi:hypothetical protein